MSDSVHSASIQFHPFKSETKVNLTATLQKAEGYFRFQLVFKNSPKGSEEKTSVMYVPVAPDAPVYSSVVQPEKYDGKYDALMTTVCTLVEWNLSDHQLHCTYRVTMEYTYTNDKGDTVSPAGIKNFFKDHSFSLAF